jgi:hypothetical protein
MSEVKKMNCEKCQGLLSDYLDGDMVAEDRRLLSAHLEECLPCFSVREDLKLIINFCQDIRGEYDEVPNAHNMWLRIRNTVETQNSAPKGLGAAAGGGLWSRLTGASWQLSFPQLAITASAIAIAVSLGTTVGIQKLRNAQAADGPVVNTMGNGVGGAAPASFGGATPGRQQIAISYWNQRVEQRKTRWSPQVRDAFERNLGIIDQAVNESRQQLIQNPHDEVSEELLNAALNEKMELLKDFSEQ